MSIAVLTEKPAVARDIARVLDARRRAEGVLYNDQYRVTWALGHLVGLAEPHEIEARWKRWSLNELPILPARWPLVVAQRTEAQFRVVAGVLNDPAVDTVVCATDAGREGELIFRLIYEASGCQKPVQRLWLSSLTEAAIRQAFANLRPGSDYDPLADAARGRSQADWLVGMNLTRLFTLRCGNQELLSVGRVQTPTLALVAGREQAIREFVPEDYQEVEARFELAGEAGGQYRGVWFAPPRPTPEARRLPADGVAAGEIRQRALAGEARVASIQGQDKRQAAPLLYDLTELQRHANRLYGYSAQATLDAAQRLYETHKLISYPRTDSRHLSSEVATTLPGIVQAIQGAYPGLAAPATGQMLGKRFVDDTRVGDHHAIVPTPQAADRTRLGEAEARLYDLICRRLLMAWHEDHRWRVTTVITVVSQSDNISSSQNQAPLEDRFVSSGSQVQVMGWKVLEVQPRRRKDEEAEAEVLPPGLAAGRPVTVLEASILDKQTRPPPRYTDASLLTAMETAGRTLDDEALAEAMKETGLGTPATRAETIETLLRRGYLERQKKSLVATGRGMALIHAVHPRVRSPALTGEWEAALRRVQRGELALDAFMREIRQLVADVVAEVRTSEVTMTYGSEPPGGAGLDGGGDVLPPGPAERPPAGDLLGWLQRVFGLDGFRPFQEPVCRNVVAGRDVLLVMPTGAGKSLCYQLPGLARGATTLVISPLIALMEDQVAKLRERQLRAERIHSGRSREALREACRDYLRGNLDFLFIAPERLSVPGFPEMLAKRLPGLIAVDEAHCISQWGHDFRPDYRNLGRHLPGLRPAPVIAMTATATPRVQADILAQLAAPEAVRHIHGFRRHNIAVEVVEVKPAGRESVVTGVLADPGRRPAIVYAPTRKDTEALASALARKFPAAAYHAGMETGERELVQHRFINGEISVMVATIAFGMGVDKPDVRTVIHTGLPASLEGYYQEIGRAGRDGAPSRALLLYSYGDRRTHEFFLNRDYPEEALLTRLQSRLDDTPRAMEVLREALRLKPPEFEAAVNRLCQYGGAVLDYPDQLRRGHGEWVEPYRTQREHRAVQLDGMLNFARGHGCRMLGMVRHFGDQEDSGEPCGICDRCEPAACVVQGFRPASAAEARLAEDLLGMLRGRDGQASGRLFRECGSDLPRQSFEDVLGALVDAGLVSVEDTEFERDGRRIPYRQVWLTPEGRQCASVGEDLQLPAPVAVETPSGGAGKARSGRRPARQQHPPPPQGPLDEALLAALKDWRREEARERQVPAYCVLPDRTLKALAASRPGNREALAAVHGVGPTVLERYGERLLALVKTDLPRP